MTDVAAPSPSTLSNARGPPQVGSSGQPVDWNIVFRSPRHRRAVRRLQPLRRCRGERNEGHHASSLHAAVRGAAGRARLRERSALPTFTGFPFPPPMCCRREWR